MSKLAKALTAAAGNAGESLYVEDVFSTYLYTGSGAARDITNGIDLDGEGGLVWIKAREPSGGGNRSHVLSDTDRGATKSLFSDTTGAELTYADIITSFNSDGFTSGGSVLTNYASVDFTSWSFRKAEKFFDVVTYTGNGANGREIPHSLNGDVGMVIVKCTSDADQWLVWHKNTSTGYLRLDGTGALVTSFAQFKFGNGTTTVNPTSSVFTVAGDSDINGSGRTYVAYLFASDAGGFGDDGSESIIKCGSYTGNGSSDGTEVDLGFEPQWLLVKGASSGAAYSWALFDNMRGVTVGSGDVYLEANTSNAESSPSEQIEFNATGFKLKTTGAARNGSGQTYIYIAIRRPMKTPESGTEVFAPVNRTATAPTYNTGFVTDMQIMTLLTGFQNQLTDRLRGQKKLLTNATDAESAIGTEATYDWMTGVGDQDSASSNNIAWNFKRATGFFDVVAYTGNGSAHAEAHNLGAVPEMIIVKPRSNAFAWTVYHKDAPISGSVFEELNLNDTKAWSAGNSAFPATAPTSTGFYLPSGTASASNRSGWTYVAYLFATLAGVSKVGSYTGNGTSQTIDCGFSTGARFVMIKSTSNEGHWIVFDSVRGIVAGNDPQLQLNTTSSESNNDWIDPHSTGFTINNASTNNYFGPNRNGYSYIFLAIA
jgi:hypothetical protein